SAALLTTAGRRSAPPNHAETGQSAEHFVRKLPGHRPFDRLLLLRGKGHSRTALVELLDVNPGVVPALDRRDDDARARRVEHRDRGGLVAARTGDRVVADDRRLLDRRVD